jgi:prolyl-tRNA synthetase
MSKPKTAITPARAENYAEWYQSVLKAADLSEHSPVRGCMVIKPWGYSIWENIQRNLDAKFKETGHLNAYFPLFIPLSFMEKEAQHVEGFAKECAVVTHHRLEKGKDGKLVPAGELEEPLIVRPTSEMIIGHSFAKWIESYRDLPLLINQWCNVVRWEMRTRMFLRTAEFLWQEGHTAHATREEAEIETKQMLQVYSDFAHDYLAIPVIRGEKTASERFPGAVNTYSIEAMMQDKKALQGGTAHFLGQNFAKSCGIQFQSISGEREFAWTTSWGVTTRLIGALVMVHSDDDGLVMPPRIASAQVVIVPIVHNAELKDSIMTYCERLKTELSAVSYDGQPMKVLLDARDLRGGEKSWSWIKKGVPIRLEIGPREVESGELRISRRDKPHRETISCTRAEIIHRLPEVLSDIQKNLLAKATQFREENTVKIDKKSDFDDFFKGREEEISGGFALCHWNGDPAIEAKVKAECNATIRCIPLHMPAEEGRCLFTGDKSPRRVLFAKAY